METRRAELHAARQRLEQDITARLAERAAVEERYAAECRGLQDAEIARRQAELDAEIAAVSREHDSLREQWRTTCQALKPGSAPAEMDRQATAAARTAWEQQRQRDEQQAASTEQWLQATEGGLRNAPERLAGCANVVAATTTALPRDAHFGERNGVPPVVFDLLILEEAHQVTESEFAAVARRRGAGCWLENHRPTPSRRPRRASWLAPPCRSLAFSNDSGTTSMPNRTDSPSPGCSARIVSSAGCDRSPPTRKNGSKPSRWPIGRRSSCASSPPRVRRRRWPRSFSPPARASSRPSSSSSTNSTNWPCPPALRSCPGARRRRR